MTSSSLQEPAPGRYDMVVAAAKRAQQIKDGARPLVEVDSNNPLTIALHEIAAGKVLAKPGDSEEAEEEPQRQERHYLTQRGNLAKVIKESEDEETETEAD